MPFGKILKLLPQTPLGSKLKQSKKWISDVTWDLISAKWALKSKTLTAKTAAKQVELSAMYRATNKQVKRSARRDKRFWIHSLAEAAKKATRKNNPKKLYSNGISYMYENEQYLIFMPDNLQIRIFLL